MLSALISAMFGVMNALVVDQDAIRGSSTPVVDGTGAVR